MFDVIPSLSYYLPFRPVTSYLGMLRRLTKKVSRAFKRENDKGKAGPWPPPFEPPSYEDAYGVNRSNSYPFINPSVGLEPWQSQQRESWTPSYKSPAYGITDLGTGVGQYHASTNGHPVVSVPEDSPIDLNYYGPRNVPQPSISRRPVPGGISYPQDEAETINDAEM